MIKKHLIACSLLLVLMLGVRLLRANKEKRLESFPKRGDSPGKEPKKDNSVYSLTFANEALPTKDSRVAKRIKKTLDLHRFENLQTKDLHYQAAKWFPIIVPILRRYGIPDDFKYIPLIESGLNHGTSHRGAAGYWQFMPETAREYGLRVNGDVDERLNIRKSTVAACKYLGSLHHQFKSWTLVAAAYNLGETKLWRRISHQKHRNYFKLKLNSETASYVYKLVSMKQIIEHPAKYGYTGLSRKLLARAEEGRYRYINPQVEQKAIVALKLLQQ